jgi:Protein of unknown function (DUF1653).
MNSIIYKHIKTGNLYKILHQAIDCTNSRDGTKVIIYSKVGEEEKVYVRDEKEWEEKFESVREEVIS